jgi:hypothetical protein
MTETAQNLQYRSPHGDSNDTVTEESDIDSDMDSDSPVSPIKA